MRVIKETDTPTSGRCVSDRDLSYRQQTATQKKGNGKTGQRGLLSVIARGVLNVTEQWFPLSVF
jgi:hypothetical protein